MQVVEGYLFMLSNSGSVEIGKLCTGPSDQNYFCIFPARLNTPLPDPKVGQEWVIAVAYKGFPARHTPQRAVHGIRCSIPRQT